MGLIECDVSLSYNAKRYSYIKKGRHRYKTTLGPIKRVFFLSNQSTASTF